MRIYRIVTTAIGGVLMASTGTVAFAGCGGGFMAGPMPGCNAGVQVHPGMADHLAPVGAYSSVPYGHLRSVEYKNTPNVNIMRVHSRTPAVNLGDAPSAFTGGCSPTSTAYCRSPHGQPVNVAMNVAPAMPAPVQVAAPVYVQPQTVTYGSGYNPANYASRQYGSTDFVPGIAHVPTSIVDRSPITHINGVPQPQVQSVTTANTYANTYASAPVTGGMAPAPHNGNYLGSVVAGGYSYQPPGGGAYWEKTSGPSIVDGLPSTQILCRREAPRPARVNVQVVRPVYGVPQPVPTPVPYAAGCAAPVQHAGGMPQGRWTY